jgi:phosphonate transport system substrate-binding protein
MIPLGHPESGRTIDAFVSALGDLLGEPVEPHHAADYRGLCAALEHGLAHMAWVPPLAVARAMRSNSIVPAVVSVRNGMTSYSTALIALSRSPYKTVGDLKDLRAAWVDRESASGYLIIRASLRAAGISLARAFSEDLFLRSHAEVARAVSEGEADVGATFFSFQSGTRDIARAGWREGGLSDDDVTVVTQAGPIPSDVFVVHQSLAAITLKLLQTALVDARPANIHQLAKDLLHADGFVRASSEHMASLHSLLVSVDTPLASFPPPPMRR